MYMSAAVVFMHVFLSCSQRSMPEPVSQPLLHHGLSCPEINTKREPICYSYPAKPVLLDRTASSLTLSKALRSSL